MEHQSKTPKIPEYLVGSKYVMFKRLDGINLISLRYFNKIWYSGKRAVSGMCRKLFLFQRQEKSNNLKTLVQYIL